MTSRRPAVQARRPTIVKAAVIPMIEAGRPIKAWREAAVIRGPGPETLLIGPARGRLLSVGTPASWSWPATASLQGSPGLAGLCSSTEQALSPGHVHSILTGRRQRCSSPCRSRGRPGESEYHYQPLCPAQAAKDAGQQHKRRSGSETSALA